MPILIILAVLLIWGIQSAKEKIEDKTSSVGPYPSNGTEKQKTEWCIKQNAKNIDKIIQKHGRRWLF